MAKYISLDSFGKVIWPAVKKLNEDSAKESKVSVVKLETAEDGFASSYQIQQNGTKVGETINIPKDLVVSSGSVVTNPEGKDVGLYIELILSDAKQTKLYIPVNDLVEYVTSGSKDGDSIKIEISDDHKVTATITDGTISEAKLEEALANKINKEVKFPTYTVNKKALTDGADTVLTGSDIALAGYTKDTQNEYDNILETDTVNAAIGKVVKSLNNIASIDNTLNLDVTDSAVDGEFVTSVSQKDGKIKVARAAIPVVTATANGLMSSADKVKLDSIEAATADDINAIINSKPTER